MSEPYDPLAPNPTFYRSSLPGSRPPAQLPTDNDPISPHTQLQPNAMNGPALQRQKMQQELEATQGIMRDNIHAMAQRGEMLDHLEQKAGDLGLVAKGFRRSATDVRKRMWWKNAKWWIILGVVVALIVAGSVVGAIKHKEIIEVMHPGPTQPINANGTIPAISGMRPVPDQGLGVPVNESILDPFEVNEGGVVGVV